MVLLLIRYRSSNNIINQELDDPEIYNMSKWLNLSNTKVPNTDTEYVSRVLILVFSKLYGSPISFLVYLYNTVA